MIMLAICEWLSSSLNLIIIVLAIFELCVTIVAGVKLIRLRIKFVSLVRGDKRRKEPPRKIGKGKISSTIETSLTRDWSDFIDFRTHYQKGLIPYNLFSLLIQIFPLLGILGTVAGLYIAMNQGQDIYQGVEFALSSTILGVLFAAIYKIFDILIVAFFINYIDEGMEGYEKDYSVEDEETRMGQYVNNAQIETSDIGYEEK